MFRGFFNEALIIFIAMNLSMKFKQFYERLSRVRQQIVVLANNARTLRYALRIN